jgi:hypothetical protein
LFASLLPSPFYQTLVRSTAYKTHINFGQSQDLLLAYWAQSQHTLPARINFRKMFLLYILKQREPIDNCKSLQKTTFQNYDQFIITRVYQNSAKTKIKQIIVPRVHHKEYKQRIMKSLVPTPDTALAL